MIVLLLHRVGMPSPTARQRKLYITRAALEGHVRWLQSKGYRFTTLSESLTATDPVACVTFDDGFADSLPELSVPATVFVITSRVGQKNVTLDAGTAPGDLATWPQLESLKKNGWEVGSHSHRHVKLTTLSAAQQTDELGESARVLKERLGHASALAYPYGAHDDSSVDAAKRAGFLCAATTRSGQATRDDPFRLNRVILSSFGAFDTLERLKLIGVHRGIYP